MYEGRDIAAEIQAMLDSIEYAPEQTQQIISDIQEIYEETCDYMLSAEERFVQQFVPEYKVGGETALNDLIRASEEKSRFWLVSSAIFKATGDDSDGFPENFADMIKDAAIPPNRRMPDDISERAQAFNKLTTDEISLTLDKGVSFIRNELASLRIRDFSRRLESYLDRDSKPGLVIT
ncbi:MAG: hypothetical protein ACTHOO_08040 [Alcanivorax sp.]